MGLRGHQGIHLARGWTLEKRPHSVFSSDWFLVFVLFWAALLAYLDRGIVAVLIPDLRQSLGISEVQVSLIQGISFSLFFALAGLPIGWLADHYPRRNMLIIGISAWSIMTIACGFAQTFWQLFAARAGVGIGEAVLAPAAYSMISDLFAPERRGKPMATIGMAYSIGGAGSAILTGLVMNTLGGTKGVRLPIIGLMENWRLIFLIAGAPGIVVIALMLTLREPVRGLSGQAKDVRDGFLRFLSGHWRVFLPLYSALVCAPLVGLVSSSWAAVILIRDFGFTVGNAGLTLGAVLLISNLGGSFAGGAIGDWLASRHRPSGRLPLFYIGTLPAIAGGLCIANGQFLWLFLLGQALVTVTAPVLSAAAYPTLHEVMPPQLRGRSVALHALNMNLLGIGIGTMAVAMMTQYVFRDEGMVHCSVAVVVLIASVVAPILILLQRKGYEALRIQFTTDAPSCFP
jgi:MFS family permease